MGIDWEDNELTKARSLVTFDTNPAADWRVFVKRMVRPAIRYRNRQTLFASIGPVKMASE